MENALVMFKLSYKNPRKKDTNIKNQAHVKYIATREGVSKPEIDIDENKLTSQNAVYLKYIDERQRSHGLFDENGEADLKQYEEEISKINTTIYRAIISLRREEADFINMKNRDSFYKMTKDNIKMIANELELNDSFKWVGAFHDEGHHPHVHVMFYETSYNYTLEPHIEKNKLDIIRSNLTKNIFPEKYKEIIENKNYLRKIGLDSAQNLLKSFSKSELSLQDEKALAKEINKIQKLLKDQGEKGRMNYKFMPENIKMAIQDLIDNVLVLKKVRVTESEYLNKVKVMIELYGTSDEKLNQAIQNARQDFRNRLGNIILKSLKEIESAHNYKVLLKNSIINSFLINAEDTIKSQSINKDFFISIHKELFKELKNAYSYLETSNSDTNLFILERINTAFNTNYSLDDLLLNNTYVNNELFNQKDYEKLISGLQFLKIDNSNIIKGLQTNLDKKLYNLQMSLDELVKGNIIIQNKNNDFTINKNNINLYLNYKDLNSVDDAILSIVKSESLKSKNLYEKTKFLFKQQNQFNISFTRGDYVIFLRDLQEKGEIIYENYTKAHRRIDYLINYGYLTKDKNLIFLTEKGENELNRIKNDIGVFLSKNEITVIEQNIKNNIICYPNIKNDINTDFLKKEMDNHFDKLEKLSFIKKISSEEYEVTEKFKIALQEYRDPSLKKFTERLDYLKRLGLIQTQEDSKIALGKEYEKYIQGKIDTIVNNVNRDESNPNKEDIKAIVDIIDKNNGILNLDKIKEKEQIYLDYITKKYLNDENKNIKPIYNTKLNKVLQNYIIICHLNKLPEDDIKSNIAAIKNQINSLYSINIETIYNNTLSYINEKKDYGNIPIISKKDYKELIQFFNLKNDEYIYQINQKNLYVITNMINDIIYHLKNYYHSEEIAEVLELKRQAERMQKSSMTSKAFTQKNILS